MGKAAAKSGSACKQSSSKAAPRRKASAKRSDSGSKDHAKTEADDKSELVEVVAENGDHVEPPPPEVLEPDPELSPEEAEEARKDYLLTRFWITARGYWGRNGDRLAWLFTIGLLLLIVANVAVQYGINVWNRAIFDAIEKRDAATVFHLTAIFFRLRSAACCWALPRYSAAWPFSGAGAPR